VARCRNRPAPRPEPGRRLDRAADEQTGVHSSRPSATNERPVAGRGDGPGVEARPPRTVRVGGDEVLGTENVTVCFGELEANHDVSLLARAGMVTALIGPNGAGKTTFFQRAQPEPLRPTTGSVRVFGAEVGPLTPSRAARLGVIRTFQT